MKKCIKCGLIKDESEFYKHRTNKDSLCKDCKICYNKIRWLRFHFKINKLDSDTYKKHKDIFNDEQKLQKEKYLKYLESNEYKQKLLKEKYRKTHPTFTVGTWKGKTLACFGENYPNQIIFHSMGEWLQHLKMMKEDETYNSEIMRILMHEKHLSQIQKNEKF